MKTFKVLFILCAISCFIAILRLPILYYTFLRIIVFVGAAIVVYYFWKQKEFHLVAIFGVILILFNPIIPIHLYLKRIWFPIDITTGILFLLLVFITKKKEELTEEKSSGTPPVQANIFNRDRIIKSSSKNINNYE